MKIGKRPYVMKSRAEKAAATRQRILDSAVGLYIDKGIEDFTLDEVARRAETTVQTVLRAYVSRDELLLAALHQLAEGGASLKPTPQGDIAAAVSAIVDLYETMGDLLIQRLGEERRRPALKPDLDKGRANHAAWVKQIFASLLRDFPNSQRAEIETCLTVVTDVYVWKKLRVDMQLDRPAVEAILRRMITSLVEKEKSDGTHSMAQLVRRRQPAS